MSRTRTLPVVVAAVAAGLGLHAPAAHAADPMPPANQNLQQVKKGEHVETRQITANQAEWGKIAEYFCSLDGHTPAINPQQSLAGARDQFSDAGIEAYDAAVRTTPLLHHDDPYLIARRVTMGSQGGSYQAPVGATKADVLRQWRYNVCEIDAYRTQWVAVLKKLNERLSIGLKPGLTSEAALKSFYDQKMQKIVTVLKAEQQRHGSDTDW
jgi:hypothetical protein